VINLQVFLGIAIPSNENNSVPVTKYVNPAALMNPEVSAMHQVLKTLIKINLDFV
jgi:hypothetical protein